MKPNQSASRVVLILTLCTALSLLGDSTLYAVLPSHYGILGLTAVHVGWLLSMNRLVRPPLNMLSGWLSRRIGPRAPYVVGLGIGALSTLGLGLLRGFWPLLAMRALWGLAWALLAVSAYGLVLDVSGQATRGRLAGAYASLSYFGGSVGAMLGGFLVDGLGFSTAMLILGGLSMLAFGAAAALLQPRLGSRGGSMPSAEGLTLVLRLRGWGTALTRLDPRLWLILMLGFAHRFLFAGVFFSTFGLYLRNALGETTRVGAMAIGVASLTATLLFLRNVITALVGPVLGHVSDLLGDRARILIMGELVGVGALVCLAFGRTWLLTAAGITLAAVTYGVVPPMLLSWMGDLTRVGERGTIIGGYQTLGDLGSGLGPLVAYALTAALDLRVAYGLSAAVLLLTVPLITRARRREGQGAACPLQDGAPGP